MFCLPRVDKKKVSTHGLRPLDIKVYQNNTTKYGNKSLRRLGPHFWNSLLKQIKEETDYNKFKNYIDKRFSAQCKCNL